MKRIFALLILVVLASTAISCTGRERPENIVFPDKEIRDYIKKARSDGSDLDTLYMDTVLLPTSEYLGAISMVDIGYLPPIKNLDELEKALKTLERENAIGIVNDALKKCDEFIEGKDVKVYLFPGDPDDSSLKYNGKGVQGCAFAITGSFFLRKSP